MGDARKDDHPLSRADLQDMAADIKRTFTSAMADIRAEMRSLTTRLGAVEVRSYAVSEVTQEHAYRLDTHSEHLQDLCRRVEGLNNQGRRHDILVRGLPETVLSGQLEATVVGIFNDLLE